MDLKTIIVIPTYNEGENVKVLIEQIFKFLPQVGILIVDDQSPDKTAEIVKELQKNFPNLFLFERPEKNGLGNAYKDAFKKVISELPQIEAIGMMDADLQHNPEDLPKLLAASKDFDLVMGSVHVPGSGFSENWPFYRVWITKFANFYCRSILRYKVYDWTNAFNIIKIEALKKINFGGIEAGGFAFIPALKYNLIRSGASWQEIPTPIQERPAGESKMTLSVIMESMVNPWRLRFSKKLKSK